jgi:hypothetical protein
MLTIQHHHTKHFQTNLMERSRAPTPGSGTVPAIELEACQLPHPVNKLNPAALGLSPSTITGLHPCHQSSLHCHPALD